LQQPWPKRRFRSEAGQGHVRLQEGILGNVLSVARLANDYVGKVKRGFLVALNKDAKRRRVATPSEFDNCRFFVCCRQ